MKVWHFERAVWELDGVRVVVRAPWEAQVGAYDYTNAVKSNVNVKTFLAKRIEKKVVPYEVVVVDGHGKLVHGRMYLSNLRESYGG